MALDILWWLLGPLFLVTGGVKVLRVPWSLRIRDGFGFSAVAWSVIGALETTGGAGLVAGVFVPPLGLVAATGLVGLMAGAMVTRVKAGDPAWQIALDAAVLALVSAGVLLYVTG